MKKKGKTCMSRLAISNLYIWLVKFSILDIHECIHESFRPKDTFDDGSGGGGGHVCVCVCVCTHMVEIETFSIF